MEPHRKNIYVHHTITNGVHQSVLISNAAAPYTLHVTFQRLWFANPCKWVLKNIFKQLRYTFHYTFVACCFPVRQVFFSLGHELYFHISSSLMTRPRPSSISFWPWRIISTIAGEDMIYSVSSIAFFWAVSFLRYLTAFFMRPSSSAMMLNSRNSSAFNSNAVISYTY